MRKIAFTKMEGCGNDYVYLDGFSEDLRLAEGDIPSLARAVSDRHYGVGSDGLVLILPPTSPAAVKPRCAATLPAAWDALPGSMP